METHKVKWHHGHFVDSETSRRIMPIQGASYMLIGESGTFLDVDEQSEALHEPMDSATKQAWVSNKYKHDYIKLLPAKTGLYFRIGNSRSIRGDSGRFYLFHAIILEDLYLYLMKNHAPALDKSWRLSECLCRLVKCERGNVELPEPNRVSASLGRLFSDTVAHYFPGQRTGSANPFDTFFQLKGNHHPSVDLAHKDYEGMLGHLRRELVIQTAGPIREPAE